MLRTATADDWTALTGLDVPAHWIGLVCVDGNERLGIGGLYEGDDGRWWACVMRRDADVRRPLALAKAARDVLAVAGKAGVEVYALADDRIEGAGKFLARLGFLPTTETMGGYTVQKWTR